MGYISAVRQNEYLPSAISTAIQGSIGTVENKLSRRLFQQSVELAMMMNLLAMVYEIDEATLTSMRGKCVRDIKRSNGSLRLEDVVSKQNSLPIAEMDDR